MKKNKLIKSPFGLKSLVTSLIMAGVFSAGAASVASPGMMELVKGQQIPSLKIKQAKNKKFNKSFSKVSNQKNKNYTFPGLKSHAGKKLYIIRLIGEPVTTYKGGISGFPKTSRSAEKGTLVNYKFDAKSKASTKYASYLDKQQNDFIFKASTELKSPISSLKSLKYAINGLVTELTYDQALKISKMPEVAFIEPNELIPLDTDTGPEFIGAGEVWDGTAATTEYMGEGIVIGILDTGVNTDHRSFAATGDDGFTATNPWGDNVYVGDCVEDASLCNSKLIGVRSYSTLLSAYASAGFTAPSNGEDYNGHGSHTSSTAGGNVLLDVPFTVSDPASGETGDGIETSLVFPRMSGVAPHANIVSYQTCLPGNNGDSLAGCFPAAGIGAIDDAIADGVDVINYSVGGSTNFNPWTSSTEIGFLNAAAAGIYVATSAGNSGPSPETATKTSPWYTAVGAIFHGRSVAGDPPVATNGAGDIMASFSSRGPNAFGQIITPQISAPGVNVYAAWSDEQPYMDVTSPAPSDFAMIGGTSMASPHVAGAAALIMQAHPTWNVDQVRSALMMTATSSVLKEDGVTPADHFDTGAGRVQVNEAINVGLVMSESAENYAAADPAAGGDPRTLNIPSIANYGCAATCSWTRTFTAVKAGTYDLTTDDMKLSVSPSSIEAVEGDNYVVTVTMDASELNAGDEVFANLMITSDSQPDLHLPIYVMAGTTSIPDDISADIGRNNGSMAISGFQSFATRDLSFTVNGLFDANATGLEETIAVTALAVDSTPDSHDDDFSELFSHDFVVGPNTASLSIAITEATSPDFDLFLYREEGSSYVFETVSWGAATSDELISVNSPVEGNYRFYVQNYASPNATDTATVQLNVVPVTDPVEGFTLESPSTSDGVNESTLTALWDREMVEGESWYADITASADGTELGTFRVTLNRVSDDVSVSSSDTLVSRGEQIDYTLSINPSVYMNDHDYSISIDMPTGVTLVEGSVVSASGGAITVKDPNAVGLNLTSEFDIPVDPTNSAYRDDLTQVHWYEFDVPSGTLSLNATISESTSPDNDLFIEFDSAGDGSFATLVAFAATGETNESATAASPSEGRYRVIVQNYASDAASDTGVVTITTVPATGEGFIFNATSLAPAVSYTAVSSIDNATCAVSGVRGWALNRGDIVESEHVPLRWYYSTLAGLEGDELIVNFGLPHQDFYGESTPSVWYSTNGFVNFDGVIDSSQWFNRSIPDSRVPNNMIAGLWKDQIVVEDGTRGIRAATLGGEPFVVFDVEGAESWTGAGAGGSTDRFTYNIAALYSGAASDDHGVWGPYEVVVSYDSNQVGTLSGATAGVENSDGTVGTDASSMIAAGEQICFDQIIVNDGFEVTFSVIPTDSYIGQEVQPDVTVEFDMVNASTQEFQGTSVELVNEAPIANAGEDKTYDHSNGPERIDISAYLTVDVDDDPLFYTWTQVSGEEQLDLYGSHLNTASFAMKDAPADSYTFNVEVSDGEFTSSDTVTITITGSRSSGVGSMGVFAFLLLLPLYFRRKITK